MHPPNTPKDEATRLEALRELNILDTKPEERFDRITRMAKRLFHVPIALVSLVDENRQWFKSCMGLEVRETPRDISFCGHTILGNGTFYIPDASSDDRFADNPLVTGAPYIRFYAGHPLRTANGEKLGTLCIIDSKPKKLDAEDLLALQDLAAMVEQELAALQLATLDELTKISNRRGFVRLAKHTLNMSQRQNVSTCLAYIDLNNFKPINDIYGHSEGDRALQIFSSQMKKTFRESDVFARIGGDEFVVLFTNTDINVANQILKRFYNDIEETSSKEKLSYDISFSYGIAEFDKDKHDSIEALIEVADQIMYRYKNSQKSIND